MPDKDLYLQQLLEKLDQLELKHDRLYSEMGEIRAEIRSLRRSGTSSAEASKEISTQNIHKETDAGGTGKKRAFYDRFTGIDLEKFIGENLINKVGIVITIIGVAIGARYAIDHNLISPAMRIVAGYGLGAGLLAFALRLKDKIPNFSAVLFSGAMAIFYIITYSAYSFYGLMSSAAAFLLMVLITAATVGASLYYRRQVVAHVGLVAAYAVPFMVGGDGPAYTLFLYMTIINAGVLSVAVYKYWRLLTLSAFVFTWLIFGAWYSSDYVASEQFATALSYSFLFFILIYLAALAYKLIQKKQFGRADIWLILANSFAFYGFGYSILSGHDPAATWLGAFTIGNALIHFTAGALIYRTGVSDTNLLYLVTGLGITFFTIAIPVELNGNWITLLWIGEALTLFLIGRTQQVRFYEKMSHPVIILAFISLIFDWNSAYPLYEMETAGGGFLPLININFFTSFTFMAALSVMVWRDLQDDERPVLYRAESTDTLMRQVTWFLLAISVYFAFRLEIQGLFNSFYIDSKMAGDGGVMAGNGDHLRFGTLWIFNYSMFFLSLLAFGTIKWIKKKDPSLILFAAVTICTVLFLQNGLAEIDLLKSHYFDPSLVEPHRAGIFHIGIRYFCFLFFGLMLYATGRMVNMEANEGTLDLIYDALLYISVLWILSNELVLWMDVASVGQPYKLGLSILWGVYALLIIALGIKVGKKHLRIGAILLLGITLFKLFFYDIANLDAIARTIVFVTLGLLLLLASFLYNKFRKEME